MEELLPVVVQAVVGIIIALIGLGVNYFRNYVINKVKNTELRESLLLTTDVLSDSVKGVLLGMGEETKKAVADGNLSQNDLVLIQERVLSDVHKQLIPATQKRVEAHVGDLEHYMLTKIAAQIQTQDKITN